VRNIPKSASDNIGYQGHVGNMRFPLLSRNSSRSALKQDPDGGASSVHPSRPMSSALSRYKQDFQGVQMRYPTRQGTPGISTASAMTPPFALAPSFARSRPDRPESAPMMRPSRSAPSGLFAAGADISGNQFAGRPVSGRPIYGCTERSRPLSAAMRGPSPLQEQDAPKERPTASSNWSSRIQH